MMAVEAVLRTVSEPRSSAAHRFLVETTAGFSGVPMNRFPDDPISYKGCHLSHSVTVMGAASGGAAFFQRTTASEVEQ